MGCKREKRKNGRGLFGHLYMHLWLNSSIFFLFLFSPLKSQILCIETLVLFHLYYFVKMVKKSDSSFHKHSSCSRLSSSMEVPEGELPQVIGDSLILSSTELYYLIRLVFKLWCAIIISSFCVMAIVLFISEVQGKVHPMLAQSITPHGTSLMTLKS